MEKVLRFLYALRLHKCSLCYQSIKEARERVRLPCCLANCHVQCLIQDIAEQQEQHVVNDIIPEDHLHGLPIAVACPYVACNMPLSRKLLKKLRNMAPHIWHDVYIVRVAAAITTYALDRSNQAEAVAHELRTLFTASVDTLPLYEEPAPPYGACAELRVHEHTATNHNGQEGTSLFKPQTR